MTYTGHTVEIPLAREGLSGSKNLTQLRPTQLVLAHNLTMENGTIQKEGGTAFYATSVSGGATIQGGTDWWPIEAVQRSVILTSNGTLLKDAGAGTYTTVLVTGLTVAGVVPVFVEAGGETFGSARKLATFTGANAVQILTGDAATATALGTPPADWSGANQPITGLVHEGRLWGALRHTWYYSTATAHDNFTGSGSGSQVVYPGEGEKIVAGAVLGAFIVTWKTPRGIYLIDTTDTSTANWKTRRITGELGIASPQAFAIVEGGEIIFMDPSGEWFSLAGITEGADVRPRPLTDLADMGPFIREQTNPTHYGKAVMRYYAHKRQLWLAVAKVSSAINNSRLKLDIGRADSPRFSFSDFVTAESLWLVKDAAGIQRPWAGDNTGVVRKLDQMARSVDGMAYPIEFQTAPTDFAGADPALGGRRKNFDFLEVEHEPKGDWNSFFDILVDGVLTDTVAINMGGAGAQLGITTTLGVDFVLGGDLVTSDRQRIVGSGRRLSIVGRNAGVGEDISIFKFLVSFTVGDERR